MMLAVQKDQHDFLFSSFPNLIVPRRSAYYCFHRHPSVAAL
jgi:hypothetical protein